MVLFDNIIQIFNLAYLDHSGKSSQGQLSEENIPAYKQFIALAG
jgi:hypothetical protein